jgi:hypothetical protein
LIQRFCVRITIPVTADTVEAETVQMAAVAHQWNVM